MVGWLQGQVVHGAGLALLEVVQHAPQRIPCAGQVLGHRHPRLGRVQGDVAHPQAMGQLLAAADMEALLAPAANEDQAGLGAFHLVDAGQGADRMEGLAGEAGRCIGIDAPHLAAFGQADHAERCAGLDAAVDHVEVAHLEDPQRHPAVREQDGAKREQGQLRQGERGRCLGGLAQSGTTASALWRWSLARMLATWLRTSRRSQMESIAPLACRNSARWKPSGNFTRTVFSITRGPAKPISALGSAITTSPTKAKPALTPPMVGSVSTLM